MNYTSSSNCRESMEDIQNGHDDRGIAIDQVGVTDIRWPIIVLDRRQGEQRTVARLTASVTLPHDFRGTHMSRFIETLNEHRGEITLRTLPCILQELKSRLDAESARIEVTFPYFLERIAPVSGARALMDYDCTFIGESNGNHSDFQVGVRVPVTSLCPCSKAISDYGAHNQRGYISVEVRGITEQDGMPPLIWIEELVEMAEDSASAPVFPILKREDERHVTMLAYDNPKFVEDVVRATVTRLQADPRISWCCVTAVNHESIHHHNAFAKVTWNRMPIE